MTTLTEARQAIFNRWVTLWVSGGSERTPTVLEGESADALDKGNVAWVRVVAPESGAQPSVTLGPKLGRKFYRRGIITVQVFTLTNKGMSEAGTLAHEARSVLEGESFSGIDVLDGTTRESGGQKGKWQLTIVELPYRFEETK